MQELLTTLSVWSAVRKWNGHKADAPPSPCFQKRVMAEVGPRVGARRPTRNIDDSEEEQSGESEDEEGEKSQDRQWFNV
jgi:hypothetical protein